MRQEKEPALLVLEDGRSFAGRSVGVRGAVAAEVVFNTSMTGYQEILTDPSYAAQVVTLTVAHVGNYGLCPDDDESRGPMAAGLIVGRCCTVASNQRATESLPAYLRRHNMAAMDNVDTRALVRHLRSKGAMRGLLVCGPNAVVDAGGLQALVDQAQGSPEMVGCDLVSTVTCDRPYRWTEAGPDPLPEQVAPSTRDLRVVVFDCGVKYSNLRQLYGLGAEVIVVPASSSADQILALDPGGVLLSNGPGDPAAVGYAIETVKALLGKVPIFGICLGHQLLSLALGAKTYKLKFGHRGGNQPVKNLRTGRVYISSHNHGFAVEADSFPAGTVEPWFVALNDNCNEGIRSVAYDAASVQFHPEAAPGPNDLRFLFDDWVAQLRKVG